MEKFKIPLDSLGIFLVIYATCDSFREQLCTFHFAKKKIAKRFDKLPKIQFFDFFGKCFDIFSQLNTPLFSDDRGKRTV